MKQFSKKGSKWWVSAVLFLFLTPGPVPDGEAKVNFSGTHLINVNVTQVTNNITVSNTETAHPYVIPHKPKVNKVPSKGNCVR